MRKLSWIILWVVLTAKAGVIVAQTASLPQEISGRWTFEQANRSNTFTLTEISQVAEGKFSASLTWWTTDPKCTIRKEPITGQWSAGQISFDAKTKCDLEFTAVLNAANNEWIGQAITKGANSVSVALKAK